MKELKVVLKSFEKLIKIIDELRVKCPWDKKQNFESLRHLTIEEVYELSEAITDKNYENIKSELGDLMLHVIFYAKIASESGKFNIMDVLDTINNKLIERHPHVLGALKVTDENHVKENWEKIKLTNAKTGVLDGVPASLPSLIKAYRLQEKSKCVGFEWETKEQVFEKVQEELNELKKESCKEQSIEKTEEEFRSEERLHL